MKYPQGGFDSIPTNYELQGNNHLTIVPNNTSLTVQWTLPQETTCTGLLCDKQRVNDWLSQRSCGCYHMTHRQSNLALVHSIQVTNDDGQNQ
eukprot:11428038-Ditylum_brightwellii.AAC.1